jgi:hypothetical protein
LALFTFSTTLFSNRVQFLNALAVKNGFGRPNFFSLKVNKAENFQSPTSRELGGLIRFLCGFFGQELDDYMPTILRRSTSFQSGVTEKEQSQLGNKFGLVHYPRRTFGRCRGKPALDIAQGKVI